jgi:mannose-6-phosphate isomerase-like protein (cupin superfamily)
VTVVAGAAFRARELRRRVAGHADGPASSRRHGRRATGLRAPGSVRAPTGGEPFSVRPSGPGSSLSLSSPRGGAGGILREIWSRPSLSGSSGAGTTLGRPADSCPILNDVSPKVVDTRELSGVCRSSAAAIKVASMDARRVATGHDDDGKAVFVTDEMVPPVTLALLPGYEFHLLWGSDSPVTFPDAGERPTRGRYFPPVGGFRFGIFTIPPDDEGGPRADLDFEAALHEFEEKLPGLGEYLEPDNPGMHTSATVDYGVVLSGEAILELDDGAKLTLRPGDTYVQNGTRHRWSNAGTVPAVVAITLVGANHTKVD